MQFYTDLMAGSVQMQDLTDEQVNKLANSWVDEKGHIHPLGRIWDAAGKEQRKREIDKARKKLKEMAFKPINKDFFK